MAYVDLNPVRAGIAATPEASDDTSIQERVGAVTEATGSAVACSGQPAGDTAPSVEAAALAVEHLCSEPQAPALTRVPLMPFDATARTPWAVPFSFADYLELVDWTGRALRPDKRGLIGARYPCILDRLNIDGERFIRCADRLLKAFGSAIGAPQTLTSVCAGRQTKYFRGIRAAQELFTPQLAA
jgi:hypothetical protein